MHLHFSDFNHNTVTFSLSPHQSNVIFPSKHLSIANLLQTKRHALIKSQQKLSMNCKDSNRWTIDSNLALSVVRQSEATSTQPSCSMFQGLYLLLRTDVRSHIKSCRPTFLLDVPRPIPPAPQLSPKLHLELPPELLPISIRSLTHG